MIWFLATNTTTYGEDYSTMIQDLKLIESSTKEPQKEFSSPKYKTAPMEVLSVNESLNFAPSLVTLDKNEAWDIAIPALTKFNGKLLHSLSNKYSGISLAQIQITHSSIKELEGSVFLGRYYVVKDTNRIQFSISSIQYNGGIHPVSGYVLDITDELPGIKGKTKSQTIKKIQAVATTVLTQQITRSIDSESTQLANTVININDFPTPLETDAVITLNKGTPLVVILDKKTSLERSFQ